MRCPDTPCTCPHLSSSSTSFFFCTCLRPHILHAHVLPRTDQGTPTTLPPAYYNAALAFRCRLFRAALFTPNAPAVTTTHFRHYLHYRIFPNDTCCYRMMTVHDVQRLLYSCSKHTTCTVRWVGWFTPTDTTPDMLVPLTWFGSRLLKRIRTRTRNHTHRTGRYRGTLHTAAVPAPDVGRL